MVGDDGYVRDVVDAGDDTISTFLTSEQTDQRVTKTVTVSFFANIFPSMTRILRC
jgi:hypothetical protein